MEDKKLLPKFANNLGWKVALLLTILKGIGYLFGIPQLATIPWFAWHPLTLSVFFLVYWGILLLGVATAMQHFLKGINDGEDNNENRD